MDPPGFKAGAPGYYLELWLASAMLGMTFPVIVAYTAGFDFWPLTRVAPATAPAVEGALEMEPSV